MIRFDRLAGPRLTALALAVGIALAAIPASPVAAHAALTGTTPEDGSTLEAAPSEVTASFSEILDTASTEIAVTGPGGALIDPGPPAFDAATFTQPMRYTEPGEYTVAFRVISEDGHRVDGAVAFTVEQIPPELVADDAAVQPGQSPATGTESEQASPTDTGTLNPVGIAIALLALLGLALAAVLVTRRRRTHRSNGGAA